MQYNEETLGLLEAILSFVILSSQAWREQISRLGCVNLSIDFYAKSNFIEAL